MDSKNDLELHIKEWVKLDNDIKNITSNLNNIRNKKNLIKDNIFDYIQKNNLQTPIIKINNSHLKFISIKQPQPLTFKYLKDCLLNCIENEDQVNLLIDYIKNNRNITTYSDIKRYDK